MYMYVCVMIRTPHLCIVLSATLEYCFSSEFRHLSFSFVAAVVKPFQEIEEQPSYDDLRAEAALHAKLRSEAFQKAAHARSLRQGEVAFFYAQQVRAERNWCLLKDIGVISPLPPSLPPSLCGQGHSHTEKMKEANMRAADLILKLQ